MPDLSPAMVARMASQARAVERAAATFRKVADLRPRFGWPVAISDGCGRLQPFTPPPADFERAARAFECHPALDPKNAIRGPQS